MVGRSNDGVIISDGARMNADKILESVPLIREWIDSTLVAHAASARSVDSLRFTKLAKYFPLNLLQSAHVVAVTNVPMPPLSKMGLDAFREFEEGTYGGVTYGSTYFVKTDLLINEPLHFHELIHVIQWQYLGWDQFIQAYAQGLLEFGYFDSPLERMARGHQQRFESGSSPYDVQGDVCRELGAKYNR